jgi:hypothetical protein
LSSSLMEAELFEFFGYYFRPAPQHNLTELHQSRVIIISGSPTNVD